MRSTARTAAPWATLFMLAVEKMKLPPVWALSASSCVSMAIKLWCMPVMVIGAYANPKRAPPTGPNVLYSHVMPAASRLPASRSTGPTKIKVRKEVTRMDKRGVVRLSSQDGVTLRSRFSILARIHETARTGRTVP